MSVSSLHDLIDIDEIQKKFTLFYQATSIPIGLYDLNGNVLTQTEDFNQILLLKPLNLRKLNKILQSDDFFEIVLNCSLPKIFSFPCGISNYLLPYFYLDYHIGTFVLGNVILSAETNKYEKFNKELNELKLVPKEILTKFENITIISFEKLEQTALFCQEFIFYYLENSLKKVSETPSFKKIDYKVEEKLIPAEQAIRQRLENYKSLFEYAIDSILILKGDSISDCNRATLELFNSSKKDLLGKKPAELSPDFQEDGRSSKVLIEYYLNEAHQGKQLYFEWKFLKSDNTYFYAEVSISSINIFGENILQAFIRDITTEHEIKENLLHSEEKFSKAFNEAPIAIILSTVDDGRFIDVNRSFVDLMGYNDKSEVIGKTSKEIKLWINDDERDKALSILKSRNFFIKEIQWKIQNKYLEQKHVLASAQFIEFAGENYLLIMLNDISERVKAEEALLESKENLSVTLDCIGDAVIVTDKQGNVTRMNPIAETLTGRNISEVLNKPLNEIFHIKNAYTGDIVENPVAKVLEHGKIVGLANHTVLISRDLNEYQIADSAAPIRTKDGTIIGVIMVFRDVSDLYLKERLLSDSEERYRIAALMTGEIVYDYDLITGQIVWAGAISEITGYSLEEFGQINNKIWLELIHPEDKDFVLEKFNRDLENLRESYVEYRLLNKNGEYFYVEDHGAFLSNNSGTAQRMIGTIKDITERKHVEEKIRRSEERYRLIFRNSPVGIIFYDKDLKITDCNEKILTILDIERMDLLGFDLFTISNKEIIATLNDSLHGKWVNYNGIYERLLNPNPIYISLSSAPFFDSYGNITGGIAIIEDISTRKQGEIIQEVIYQIALAASNAPDMAILSEIIQNLLSKIVDTKNFFIAYYDKNTDMIDVPYFIDEEDPDTTFPAGKTMTSYVIKNNIPLLADEDEIRKMVEEEKIEIIGSPCKVWLGVPLRIETIAVGALVIQNYKNKNAINNEHLKILQFVSEQISQVITRKYIEQSLKDSEEKYRLLVNQLPLGVYRVDKNGNVLFANKALAKILQYDNIEDFKKINVKDTFIENRNEDRQYELWKNSGSQYVSQEIQLKTKTGSIIWVHDNFSVIRGEDDNVIYFEGILEDITERKLYEESLRRFERIVNTELDMIALVDVNYKYLIVNKAYEKAFLKSFEQLTKITLSENIGNEFFDSFIKEKFDKAIKGENIQYQVWYTFPGLGKIYVDVKYYPYIGFDNNIEGVVIGLRDITEQKLFEDEIKTLNEDLEKRVAERTSQLENAIEELLFENDERKRTQDELAKANERIALALENEKDLGELKNRFISMISHEYRTPLTVILNSTYIIEKLYEGSKKFDFIEYLNKIRHSIKGMTNLLEDVLIIQRSEAGKLTSNADKINLNEICKDVIEHVRVVDKDSHEFIFTSSITDYEMDIDEKLLRQILNNLLLNASKYSMEHTKIKLNLIVEFDKIIFEVSDQGIGIPKDDIEKLFYTFYRGRNVGNISGTGLGLSIVKRSVEILNGKISIISEENNGSVFTVTIPKSFSDK